MGLFSSIGSALGISSGSAFTGAMTLASGLLGSRGQRQANQQNVELANTAYQRAMSDMRKAGLNPILAGKLGGAQSPTMLSEIGAGLQSASSAAQTASNVQFQESQSNLLKSQVDKVAAEIGLTEGQTELLEETAYNLMAQAGLAEKSAGLAAARTTGQAQLNSLQGILEDFYKSNEAVYIAKDLGLDAGSLQRLLGNVFQSIFGRFKIQTPKGQKGRKPQGWDAWRPAPSK